MFCNELESDKGSLRTQISVSSLWASFRELLPLGDPHATRVEAIATRLEAIAIGLEAIAIRLEANYYVARS